jgi:NADH:ubiquinone oxidoreductase subunit 5 (subunit L)/multisubunit Na+/H+ antiporter MnhA subunit
MAGRGPRLQRWIAGGWGFDDLYHHLAVLPARDFARAAAWLDHRVFDRAVNGVGRLGMVLARLVGRADHQLVDGSVRGARDAVLGAGRRVAALQSGRISGYLLGVTAGVAVFAILAYLLGS